MTPSQENVIFSVRRKINEIRGNLDALMYGQDIPISEHEFQKVREAYDLICKANDKLP